MSIRFNFSRSIEPWDSEDASYWYKIIKFQHDYESDTIMRLLNVMVF